MMTNVRNTHVVQKPHVQILLPGSTVHAMTALLETGLNAPMSMNAKWTAITTATLMPTVPMTLEAIPVNANQATLEVANSVLT